MSNYNGALDICILQSGPNTDISEAEYQRTGMQILPDEWSELFYNELKVPSPEPYTEGEVFVEYDRRQKMLFEDFLRERSLPMLGKISDIYQDVVFLPSEVDALYLESSKLSKLVTSELAQAALSKLFDACVEAKKYNFGLILTSD